MNDRVKCSMPGVLQSTMELGLPVFVVSEGFWLQEGQAAFLASQWHEDFL